MLCHISFTTISALWTQDSLSLALIRFLTLPNLTPLWRHLFTAFHSRARFTRDRRLGPGSCSLCSRARSVLVHMELSPLASSKPTCPTSYSEVMGLRCFCSKSWIAPAAAVPPFKVSLMTQPSVNQQPEWFWSCVFSATWRSQWELATAHLGAE